jgi:hypothetical protein
MGPEGVLLGTLVASLLIAPWTWRECLRALDASPMVLARVSLLPVLVCFVPLGIITASLVMIRPVSPGVWFSALAVFGVVWCATAWFGALSARDRTYLREVGSRLRLSRLTLRDQPASVKN